MTKLYASVAVAAMVGLGGWTLYWGYTLRASDPFAECRAGQVGGGDIGGPFTLTDDTGATVTEKEVLAKPSLVYFGYTFCPDVCPMDNARNADAIDLLDKMGLDVTPVFISVDPKRDTPKVLADFTDNLHPKMIGLTGTPEQVKAVALAYKTYFKIQDTEAEFYMVDHSTFTYLMLPGTGFADFFTREASAQQIADTVACFAKAAK